jgi:phage/plasmid-like protein (TIGR03299 family)
MAHEVRSMFSVKETPWHKLGKVLPEAPTIAQAIEAAGLNWDVILSDAYFPGKDENGNTVFNPLPDYVKVVTRSDTGEILGTVGPNTHPLQNRQAFDFFQPYLDAKEASLETAGALRGGSRVWVLASINRDPLEIVKGDEVLKYVLLSHAHDNSLAVRVGFTPIRVVCANTLRLAHGDKASKLIRIRHTSQVVQNLEKVRETMNLADREFQATAEQYRALATRAVNPADLKTYIKTVFDMKTREDGTMAKQTQTTLDDVLKLHEKRTGIVQEILAEVAAREAADAKAHQEIGAMLLDTVVDKVTENFEAGKGSDIPAARGSYWTAYNAVTEYLAWNRGRSDESRLDSTWYGNNFRTNGDALKVALDMSGVGAPADMASAV